MELIVVLTILVALAAILIPLLPNMLRRAHKATDATQTSEVAKSVQLYQGLYLAYPDDWDLLTDGTAMPSYLPTDDTTVGPFGGFATAQPLTAAELAALRRVGINFVQKLAPNTSGANFHPTLNPYAGTIATDRVDLGSTAATSTNFAVLDRTRIAAANPNFLQTEFDADPTARYVLFGVGGRSTMVGQTMQDAPISVPQKKNFTPDNTYSRVGVIFKVSGAEVNRTERARFIACVALEDDELETTEKDIIGYYQLARDPRNP
jgi:type II secretory pathway pseudopilin PulG